MDVYVPVVIGAGNNVWSNAPGSAYPVWSAGTSYSVGLQVQFEMREYESLADGNVGNIPSDSPDAWLDLGATNPWRAFDGVVGTQAEADEYFDPDLFYAAGRGPHGFVADDTDALTLDGEWLVVDSFSDEVYDSGLAYRLTVGGPWDTMVLLGLDAAVVDVVVRTQLGVTVFEKRFKLDQAVTLGSVNSVAVTSADLNGVGLEQFDASYVLFLSIIPRDGATAKLGNLLLGLASNIGCTLYPAEVGGVDFSVVDEDQFGRVTLVPGNWVSRADLTLVLDEERVPQVFRILSDLRGTAAVWIASEEPRFSPLIIYGFRKRYPITYQTYGTSYVSLELRGLV